MIYNWKIYYFTWPLIYDVMPAITLSHIFYKQNADTHLCYSQDLHGMHPGIHKYRNMNVSQICIFHHTDMD